MSLNIDPSVVKRLNELKSQQNKDTLFLHIRVEGGGCSGFQYKMELTDEKKENDLIFKNCVITDDISIGFLDGATISFDDDLIGAQFRVENPNAVSGCGCGTSFSVI